MQEGTAMSFNWMQWLRPKTSSITRKNRRSAWRPKVESLEPRLVPADLLPGFQEQLVAAGLSAPTAMAFSPDGRLFVAEQGGRLRIVKDGALLPTPFVTVSTTSSGERGLLGIAFDPYDLLKDGSPGHVYVYYTVPTAPIHNRISRFTPDPSNPDVAMPGSQEVILDLNNLSSATNHNGGAIHFNPGDGMMYVGVGENANSANAQDLSNLLGKVLRINAANYPDSIIPKDNPFVGVPGVR